MFEEVFPSVFSFISRAEGSNCFLLLGGRDKALIDSSAIPNGRALIENLAGLGLKPDGISLILHSHGHADHFGNDCLFPNAKIAMHKADADRINSQDKALACTQFFPGTKMPKISVFLEDSQEIKVGDFSLKVVHCPGHTAGSVCFFEQARGLLFSGDTLFSNGLGRTDLPTGNPKKLAQSLKKLQKLAFKALFPGHGPVLLGKEENSRSLANAVSRASTNGFL